MQTPLSAEEKEAQKAAEIAFKKVQLKARRAKFRLRHPLVKRALATIAEAHRNRGNGSSRCGVTVVGESRSGKSTLTFLYAEQYPDDEVNGVPRRRVVVLSFPSATSSAQVTKELCRLLGDPLPHKGDVDDRLDRFTKILIKLGVELLIFDEGHHLVEGRSDKVALQISRWLKTLIDRHNLGVVLLGTKEVRRATELNREVRNRFFTPVELTAFGDAQLEKNGKLQLVELGELRIVLAALQSHFDQTQRFSLNSVIMAQRFILATDGLIGLIVDMVERACEYAIDDDRETINMSDLARTYDLYIGRALDGGVGNPFRGNSRLVTALVRNGGYLTNSESGGTNNRIVGKARKASVGDVLKVGP